LAALFIRKGTTFEPTELTRGPWDPQAQHGGAPAALMAGELERIGQRWPIVRFDLQFLRPVPLSPLSVAAEVEREGRTTRRLRALMEADDKPVCIADALQIRPNGPVPAVGMAGEALAPPGSAPEAARFAPGPMFAGDGVELRFVRGSLEEPGPAAGWFRLRVPVVRGEQTTPLQRAAAAADFGNGASSVLSWEEYTFINPELTLYLLREPEGDWVGLDATTSIEADGVGLSDITLHDSRGPFGRALQALVVAPRP
jgi:acyl-Coa thioesterase superfamily protein/acyl-CoA thioesterase superfamily protein